MTTPGDVLAASGVALDRIYRDGNGMVSIQTSAPYQDGRYAGQYVQHCGISVCYLYTLAGLVMGRDFPDLAYTPSGAQAAFDGGFAVETPQPGDAGIIDWAGNGWGATGSSDHATLIIGTDNWPYSVSTREWNTTDDGTGRDYERSVSLFTVFIRPRYNGAPAGPVKGPWLQGGPVGLADLKAGANNATVARVQDAVIAATGKNEPQQKRFLLDGRFLLNYQRWQQSLGYTGADADGFPGRTSLERLGFTVVDGTTLSVAPVGAILARYKALGGEKSVLGKPVAAEVTQGPGKLQRFEHGAIHWDPKRGAVEVYGTIGGRWLTDAAARKAMGLPCKPEADVPGVKGARWQQFDKGVLFWNPTLKKAFLLYGAILARYKSLTDAQRATLGYLRTDEQATVPAGRWNAFVNGCIVWSSATGAVEVTGSMSRLYLAAAGTQGLGFPKAVAQVGPAEGWHTQAFSKGTVAVRD